MTTFCGLQAWIATVADKLEVSLESFSLPARGFGAATSKTAKAKKAK